MKTIIRIASIVSCATVALALAPAEAGTFGRQSVGQTPSSGMSTDFKRGSKFTLAQNGVIDNLCAYLDGFGGGVGYQSYELVVYRDDHGAPGAKVVESGEDSIGSGTAPGWACLRPTIEMPVSAGDYWLVIHTGRGVPAVGRYYYDGPTGWYGGTDTFADGASNPFGSGGSGAGTISLYATYTTAYHSAGRASIGSSWSSGMSSEFKRASSMTITETGLLLKMGAYLDGLGATAQYQVVGTALYRDDNGVPGALVAEASAWGITAGQRASWQAYVPYEQTKVTPGKYWIALLSAGTPGVARYALDGTGNWYGNADDISDRFSNPFGAGNPGNGTISAFVNYQPGTFTPGQFGRTDVASTSLKGLTPNFIRGSRFAVPDTDTVKLVNALYAYLDGNGGASGSQALRMALYLDSPDDGATTAPLKIVQSEVVNIPARTPPGWVRFPVPFTNVSSGTGRGYWIVIHSGNTGGVVRSYGDGAANWHGNEDAFIDGPVFHLDDENGSTGTVTLSVYATYEEFHPSATP